MTNRHVSPPSRPATALIALLAGLSMLGPFAIDTFFPAFPAIAGALSATPFQMQQTLSLYLVAYAMMALLHGGLSDALGRRPVILVSMTIFALASIGCALSQTIEQLLSFRVLQGLSAGAGVIVGRAIVRDCFEGARAQRVMSGISMIFGIAPAVGADHRRLSAGAAAGARHSGFWCCWPWGCCWPAGACCRKRCRPEARKPLQRGQLGARLSAHAEARPLCAAVLCWRLQFRSAVPVHQLGAEPSCWTSSNSMNCNSAPSSCRRSAAW